MRPPSLHSAAKPEGVAPDRWNALPPARCPAAWCLGGHSRAIKGAGCRTNHLACHQILSCATWLQDRVQPRVTCIQVSASSDGLTRWGADGLPRRPVRGYDADGAVLRGAHQAGCSDGGHRSTRGAGGPRHQGRLRPCAHQVALGAPRPPLTRLRLRVPVIACLRASGCEL